MTPQVGEQLLKQRRRRDIAFGPLCKLFGEPAWDLILAVGSARRPISIVGACAMAGAPDTTALRHLGRLIGAGLIVRERDELDRRRHWLTLTTAAHTLLDAAILPEYRA